jgi:bifunctional oligoribonuclease and PAP phosphatase NrnA
LSIINKEKLNTLSGVIERSKKVLITTHVNSDGDAIGSTLALAHILKKAGKEVMVMTPNDFPEFLQWLPGQEFIAVHYRGANKIKEWAKEADLLFAVDYNDQTRLKNAEKIFTESTAFKVLIDHHPFPADFTDLDFSYTGFGSAAELLYNILKETGLASYMDHDIATCLFTGIMTDTGCFSFNSSYPEVYTTVSELLSYGIDKDFIYSKIYDNFSENRMRLMGYCLNEKMVLVPGFKVAYISISENEMKKFSHSPGDTEGFVNLPFSIKGVVFSALFIEKKDHVKISFRSRGTFPANEFSSKHFSGGGHLNASGGESKEALTKVIEKFISSLHLYKQLYHVD